MGLLRNLIEGRHRAGRVNRSLHSDLRRGRSGLALPDVTDVVGHSAFVPVLLTTLAFIAAVSALVVHARSSLLVPERRIMDETRLARVEFRVEDSTATERERAVARERTPVVLGADAEAIDTLAVSVQALPAAASTARAVSALPMLALPFELSDQEFAAAQAVDDTPEGEQAWASSSAALEAILRRTPILSPESAAHLSGAPAGRMNLVMPDGSVTENVPKERAVALGSPELEASATRFVANAGFRGPLAAAIVRRITRAEAPTFVVDAQATDEARRRAADAVPRQVLTYPEGSVIYARGERLRDDTLARRENKEFHANWPAWKRWLERAGVAASITLMTAVLGAYLRLFYPRIITRPWRLFAIASLMLFASGMTVWVATSLPGLKWLAIVGPTSLVAMIMVVAYDRRLALTVAAVQAIVACIALRLPAGAMAVLLTAVGIALWQLRDIRHRNDLVRAGVLVGLGSAVGVVVTSLLDRPIVTGIFNEIGMDALLGALGGFAAGILTLGLLPTIERRFDITTGMTLSEWRDPRQPLLRLLQQRAPGTFSHSHAVASLAESAAEAIGADPLHAYVGALYHDIGKMNKPEYFIENQVGGINKHNKLSPAMSLLVVVGHVKDGLELAREYALPRSLHHYIEAHHGTTLVRYFYERARKLADGHQDEEPQEVEYRYPGPRPRTREVAILMICDAVESAARALTEPTPARIQALVHDIAMERLHDGQFDDCDLSLRDIARIEDAITKSLCANYHARIAYPGGVERPAHGGAPAQPSGAAAPASARSAGVG